MTPVYLKTIYMILFRAFELSPNPCGSYKLYFHREINVFSYTWLTVGKYVNPDTTQKMIDSFHIQISKRLPDRYP